MLICLPEALLHADKRKCLFQMEDGHVVNVTINSANWKISAVNTAEITDHDIVKLGSYPVFEHFFQSSNAAIWCKRDFVLLFDQVIVGGPNQTQRLPNYREVQTVIRYPLMHTVHQMSGHKPQPTPLLCRKLFKIQWKS